MNQNVYIEFGVGTNYENVKQHALQNYYTIVIDKIYKAKYIEPYEKNKHFVDKQIIGDWINDYDIPLADKWSCVSCFEHIHYDDVNKSIEGIIKKIKKNSTGFIHIDLTDHLGGFKHYNIDNKKRHWPFINDIKSKEWKQYFSNYFDFDYKEVFFENINTYPKQVKFHNVKLKET